MKIKAGGSDIVYDIPYLQKKGLLKKSAPTKFESGHKFVEGYAVLTPEDLGTPGKESTAITSPSTTTESAPSPFSFLDSLAGASSQSAPLPSSSTSDIQQLTNDLANAKVKIEDLEYKIDRLIERLEKLEVSKL